MKTNTQLKTNLFVVTVMATLTFLSSEAQAAPVKSIVLVHGAFVDGSGWRGVYDILKKDGYSVSIVQNPTESLEGDVAAAKRVIDAENGDVLLVGHSYGGAVITEAGNDPKVTGLVYVAAFVPDEGESVGALNSKPAPDASKPPILPAAGRISFHRPKRVSGGFCRGCRPGGCRLHGGFPNAVGPQGGFRHDHPPPRGRTSRVGISLPPTTR